MYKCLPLIFLLAVSGCATKERLTPERDLLRWEAEIRKFIEDQRTPYAGTVDDVG